MTKQDIFAIFDKNATNQRKTMKIILWVGIIFIIGGFALIPAMHEKDIIPVVSIFSGIGLLLVLIAAISLGTNSFEKKTQGIKDLLDNRPDELVWGYVFKQTNRGAVTISVMMNFRDGKVFQVIDTSIPNKDTSAFLSGLSSINPNMHVGYSEELEYKFKKKTL